ncbi:MAG TPA: MFS transporter [Beijerinckiaceae bacterium]|jgi:predicted MFS family arabinose efflux permease|nr:MFS transporter [Beijerinckiaceae bacterium]
MILILAVSGFASTSAGRSVEPLVGVIARDLRSDPHTVALLATAFALPYAFIQPILGPVADALGKERIFPICLGTLAVAMALCAAAPTIELLFALRVLAGMAAGGVIPTSLGMIGDKVAMASRQVAISRFLAAVILGQLAGSSVSGLLAAWIGWRGVFGLAAALTAVAALGAILGFRESRRPPERLSLAEALERYRRVLTNRRARFLYAFVFVDGMAFFGLMPYVAPNLEAHAAGGPFEAGLVLAGFALGGLLYSALVTWLLRVLGLGRMFVSGGCAAGAALLGLAFGQGWILEAALMVALGTAFYMIHNSYQTQVTEVVPDARASAIAFHAFSFFIGQALGVALFGAGIGTLGWTASLTIAAVTAVALGAVSAWVLVWGPQPPRR